MERHIEKDSQRGSIKMFIKMKEDKQKQNKTKHPISIGVDNNNERQNPW